MWTYDDSVISTRVWLAAFTVTARQSGCLRDCFLVVQTVDAERLSHHQWHIHHYQHASVCLRSQSHLASVSKTTPIFWQSEATHLDSEIRFRNITKTYKDVCDLQKLRHIHRGYQQEKIQTVRRLDSAPNPNVVDAQTMTHRPWLTQWPTCKFWGVNFGR